MTRGKCGSPPSGADELGRLQRFCVRLLEAIDEFDHEIRRCSDALERAGGTSPEHEARLRVLRANKADCVVDLRKAREAIKALGAGAAPR